MKIFLLALLGSILLLSGCNNTVTPTPTQQTVTMTQTVERPATQPTLPTQPTQPNTQATLQPAPVAISAQLRTAVQNAQVNKINNPNLTLPNDIHEKQVETFFEAGDFYLALVQRSSMNVFLDIPQNVNQTFAGVLIAKKGDAQWKKYLEIKDAKATDKNNPYYVWKLNNKLVISIVDQNGAGSGEGIMKLFELSQNNKWTLDSCYYFGGSYSDPAVDGDYFAYSTKDPEPLASCNNVSLIQYD